MTQKSIVKILLLDQNGKFLFLKRSNEHPLYGGQLDLPGGLAEANESPADAIKRELLEETKIILKNEPILIKTTEIATGAENINYSLYFAIIESFKNTNLSISEEHTAVLFLTKEDIKNYDTAKLTDNYIITAINTLKNNPDISTYRG